MSQAFILLQRQSKESQAGRLMPPCLRIPSSDMIETMSLISKILPLENVILDAESSSKKRVFERVGIVFENTQQIARSQVFDSLFTREKLGSTGLGQGVAIPHGRIKGLRDAIAAFVKTQTPIPFDAPDGQPVNLIFVLLVPERATDLHLQLLGELAQMFSDKSFRARLQASDDPAAIHQMFAEWKA
jgi:PTS system nitrogen regulatory IIA component